MRGKEENPSRSTTNYLLNNKQAFRSGGGIDEKAINRNSINTNTKDVHEKIFEFRQKRKNKQDRMKNLTIIKRSNKVLQALDLPTVLNLNPRSVYNKVDEFIKFVEEEDIDLVCMSESWERENKTLDEIIEIEGRNCAIIVWFNIIVRKTI